MAGSSRALGDVVLFDNRSPPAAPGGISTGNVALNGAVAPPGTTWSELANDTGNTTEANLNNGFGANMDVSGPTNPTGGFHLADDFTIPAGQTWTISSLMIPAYKTNSAPIPSPIDNVRLKIWNGRPGDAGVAGVFGNFTVNRLVGSVDGSIFRMSNTVVPVPGGADTSRRVWINQVSTLSNVTTGTPLVLGPGTYWIDFQTSDTANGNHFVPTVTTPGARTQPGANARHFQGAAPGSWIDLVDVGNPASAPDAKQEIAFQVVGVSSAGCLMALPTCAADIANGDGLVNIDDLLAVINTWGQNNSPNGPRPVGDCAPPPNGNCLVNIDDLLKVISSWGLCPPATGACCMLDGSCAAVTLAQCSSSGGAYKGDGTLCVNVNCPIPNNDTCTNAKALNFGQAICDTLDGATVDSGAPICNTSSRGFGRWYTVIGNGKNLKADLCTAPAGGFDATDFVLSVYCGLSCTDLTCVVAANVDSCGIQGESVTWCSAVGQKYWVLVHAPALLAPGSNDYCVKVTDLGTTCSTTLVCGTPPPANDECAGAATLVCGGSATVTAAQYPLYTVNASDPVASCTAAGVAIDGSWWYTITTGPAQTSLNLSMCATNGTLDTLLSVYRGSCGALIPVACDDDSCSAPSFGPSKLCATVTPNTVYKVLVQHYAPTQPGDYIITADCVDACVPPPPPPANDECSGAQAISCGQTLTVTSAQYVLYTINGTDPVSPCNSGPFDIDRSWWYTFTTGAGQTKLTVSMCSSSSLLDTVVSLYSGTCGSLTPVSCDDDSCVAPPNLGPSRFCATVLPNTTYKILVQHYSPDQVGDYSITIDCVTPCP